MTTTGPAVPAAPTDPRELALHLEICRMQAELEGLERRIREVEAARADGGSGYDPFVARAEELVERMVSSLYVSGRSEIAAASATTDEQAEALLDDARRRANAILAAARAELARTLNERAEELDEADDRSVVVDLTDAAADLDRVATDVLAGPDAPAVPDAEAELLTPPAPEAEPLPAGTEPSAAAVVEADQPDTAPAVEPAAGVAEAAAATAPEQDLAPAGPPAEADAPLRSLRSFPPPTAAPSGPNLPPLPSVGDAVEAPVEPPTDAPGEAFAGGSPAGVAEAARTDAAFNAWLAVGPSLTGEEAAAGAGVVPEKKKRAGWVWPLEAALALAVVVAVLIVALLLVG